MRFLLALLLALGWLTQAAAGTTLKIATVSPEGTSWMTSMRAAADEIAKRTEQRVELRFYPGGVMGNDKAVLRKIRAGQLHGGAVISGALAELLPDIHIYAVPFLFRGPEEVAPVRKELDPVLIKRLQGVGLISYGFAEGGFSYLMSKQPVRTLADMQARKVWAPEGDKISETAFAALKISPISLPLTDVLTGLQSSLVDTVGASPMAAIALQWHTQVSFLTEVPLTYVYGTLVIAETALKGVSAADQATLKEVLTETFVQLDNRNRSEDREAMGALKAQGIEFVMPAKADRTQWETQVADAISKLAAGGFFTKGLLPRVQEILRARRGGG